MNQHPITQAPAHPRTLFGAVHAADGSATDVLIDVAREFSPRIEIAGSRVCGAGQARQVVLDLSGLTRLFGDARAMGVELVRTAAERGLRVRVAIAGTRTAARLLASAIGDPVTVVDPGTESTALAPLPIALLAVLADDEPAPAPPSHRRTLAPSHPRTLAPSHRRTVAPSPPRPLAPSPPAVLATFRRWGLRTLGEVAALPADAVAARLGQEGVRWQRAARGEDTRPLLPAVIEERFEQALDLEWPIEGLEPLSFVLGRLMEPLSAQLERRGRGAAVLHVRLHLVTRVVHARSLQLPAPMRDARTLRTLALLDLESHPPAAAIDRVVVAIDPTPARVLQYSLLTRPLPSPDQVSTLMARLTALMGEGRCGSPAVADTWEPGAFVMKCFAPSDPNVIHRHDTPRHRDTEVSKVHEISRLGASVPRCSVEVHSAANQPALALRRFRCPVPARVRAEQGRPVRVVTDRVAIAGGGVVQCAGPWRTTGGWWTDEPPEAGASRRVGENDQQDRRAEAPGTSPRKPRTVGPAGSWDRDEWDVTLSDHATYRVYRDRRIDAWFIEGVVD